MSKRVYKAPDGTDLLKVKQRDEDRMDSCTGCYFEEIDLAKCKALNTPTADLPCCIRINGPLTPAILYIYVPAFP